MQCRDAETWDIMSKLHVDEFHALETLYGQIEFHQMMKQTELDTQARVSGSGTLGKWW
jgi:hypothetical protein